MQHMNVLVFQFTRQPVTDGFLSQKASDAENVYMPLSHYAIGSASMFEI